MLMIELCRRSLVLQDTVSDVSLSAFACPAATDGAPSDFANAFNNVAHETSGLFDLFP
jgi:hypothetical protein